MKDFMMLKYYEQNEAKSTKLIKLAYQIIFLVMRLPSNDLFLVSVTPSDTVRHLKVIVSAYLGKQQVRVSCATS